LRKGGGTFDRSIEQSRTRFREGTLLSNSVPESRKFFSIPAVSYI